MKIGPKDKQPGNTGTFVVTQQQPPGLMNNEESLKLFVYLFANKRYDRFFQMTKQLRLRELFALSENLLSTKNTKLLAVLHSSKGAQWSQYLAELHKMDASVPLIPPADIQDDKKDSWYCQAVMQAALSIDQRQNEEFIYLKQHHPKHKQWIAIDTQDINPDEVTLVQLMTRHQQLNSLNESLIRTKIEIEYSYLILRDLRFTRLPESLFNDASLADYWENLLVLDCRYNFLQQLPNSIEKLKSLEKLNCSGCQLKQLPEALGNLAQLRKLDCNSNLIQQLSNTLSNLIVLEKLNCSFNELKELPGNLRDKLGDEWYEETLEDQNTPTIPQMLSLYKVGMSQTQQFNRSEATQEAVSKNLANLKLN